jgi:uncharacterized protein YpuA (DUF1002 family)
MADTNARHDSLSHAVKVDLDNTPRNDRIRIRKRTPEEIELARELTEKSKDLPTRKALIEKVRKQIEAGEYDTPDKLDTAMSRILDDLGK